jgi:hypothetical protein
MTPKLKTCSEYSFYKSKISDAEFANIIKVYYISKIVGNSLRCQQQSVKFIKRLRVDFVTQHGKRRCERRRRHVALPDCVERIIR